MHMLIFLLTSGLSSEDALNSAKRIVLDHFIGEQGPFDYAVPFDDDYTDVAGKNRWKNIPAVMKADSPEALKIIDDMMKQQRLEFDENILALRDILSKKTGDDLFEDDDIRYRCHVLSCCNGPHVRLYLDDQAIIRKKDLKDAYERHEKLNVNTWEKKRDLWLVPFDVHI